MRNEANAAAKNWSRRAEAPGPRASLCCLAALLCACGGQFKPETLVEALRVLSVTAEPPEVSPGESASLGVLWSDPSRLGQPTTVLWVGCQPDPLDLGRTTCSDATILLKPTLITDYPEDLQLLGFGPVASYLPKADVFSVLPEDDPIRHNGTVGVVLALVVGEEVDPLATGDKLRGYFERIENRETQAVAAIARVLVSERTPKNQNPTIGRLTVAGAPHPPHARLQVRAGQRLALRVSVPEAARETYTLKQPSGLVEETEAIVGAWYSSSGRFSQARFDVFDAPETEFVAPGSAEAPDDPVPERRTGTVYLVVRDDRGGQAFTSYPFYVCDASAAPKVTALAPPSGSEDRVVVTGENLANALDVVVGDVALAQGSYSPGRQAFLGAPPELPPGTYPVRVRGKDCSDADTGLTYTVP